MDPKIGLRIRISWFSLLIILSGTVRGQVRFQPQQPQIQQQQPSGFPSGRPQQQPVQVQGQFPATGTQQQQQRPFNPVQPQGFNPNIPNNNASMVPGVPPPTPSVSIPKPLLFQLSSDLNLGSSGSLQTTHLSRYQTWFLTAKILSTIDDRLKPDYVVMMQPPLQKGIPTVNLTQVILTGSALPHPDVLRTLIEQSSGMLTSQQSVVAQRLRSRLNEPGIVRSIMSSENPAELFTLFSPPLLQRSMGNIIKSIGELPEASRFKTTSVQAKLLPTTLLSSWLTWVQRTTNVQEWTAEDLFGRSFFGLSHKLNLAILGLGCQDLQRVPLSDLLLVLAKYRSELYELRKFKKDLVFPINLRNCALTRVLELLQSRNQTEPGVNLLSTLRAGEISAIGGEILTGVPRGALETLPVEIRQGILEEIGRLEMAELTSLTQIEQLIYYGNRLLRDIHTPRSSPPTAPIQQGQGSVGSEVNSNTTVGGEGGTPGASLVTPRALPTPQQASMILETRDVLGLGNLLCYATDIKRHNLSGPVLKEVLETKMSQGEKTCCMTQAIRTSWTNLLLETFGDDSSAWEPFDLASMGDLLIALPEESLKQISTEALGKALSPILRQSGFSVKIPLIGQSFKPPVEFIDACTQALGPQDGPSFKTSYLTLMRRLLEASQWLVGNVKTADEVMSDGLVRTVRSINRLQENERRSRLRRQAVARPPTQQAQQPSAGTAVGSMLAFPSIMSSVNPNPPLQFAPVTSTMSQSPSPAPTAVMPQGQVQQPQQQQQAQRLPQSPQTQAQVAPTAQVVRPAPNPNPSNQQQLQRVLQSQPPQQRPGVRPPTAQVQQQQQMQQQQQVQQQQVQQQQQMQQQQQVQAPTSAIQSSFQIPVPPPGMSQQRPQVSLSPNPQQQQMLVNPVPRPQQQQPQPQPPQQQQQQPQRPQAPQFQQVQMGGFQNQNPQQQQNFGVLPPQQRSGSVPIPMQQPQPQQTQQNFGTQNPAQPLQPQLLPQNFGAPQQQQQQAQGQGPVPNPQQQPPPQQGDPNKVDPSLALPPLVLRTQSDQEVNRTVSELERLRSLSSPPPQPNSTFTCRGIKAAGHAGVGLTLTDLKSLSADDLFNCIETLGNLNWDEDMKIELLRLFRDKLHLSTDHLNTLNLIELGNLVSALPVKSTLDSPSSDSVNQLENPTVFDISKLDLTLPSSLDTLTILSSHIQDPKVLTILTEKFNEDNGLFPPRAGQAPRPDFLRVILWSIGSLLCGFNDTVVNSIFELDRSLYIDVSPRLGVLENCSPQVLAVLASNAILPSNYGPPNLWSPEDLSVIGVVVAGLKPDQVASLSTDAISGLSPLAIRSMSTAALQGLSSSQLSNLSLEAAGSILPTQVEVLHPDQVEALNAVLSVSPKLFNLVPSGGVGSRPGTFNLFDSEDHQDDGDGGPEVKDARAINQTRDNPEPHGRAGSGDGTHLGNNGTSSSNSTTTTPRPKGHGGQDDEVEIIIVSPEDDDESPPVKDKDVASSGEVIYSSGIWLAPIIMAHLALVHL